MFFDLVLSRGGWRREGEERREEVVWVKINERCLLLSLLYWSPNTMSASDPVLQER